MSIGAFRNKPCVCGSGKKYKVCCWGKQPNEIRYQHIHKQDNPSALCLTCRELNQKLAVKSALPDPTKLEFGNKEKLDEKEIRAEL